MLKTFDLFAHKGFSSQWDVVRHIPTSSLHPTLRERLRRTSFTLQTSLVNEVRNASTRQNY